MHEGVEGLYGRAGAGAGGLWDGPRGQDERGMSGYAALTRLRRVHFASITRERPVTCGGSEKPLLSRRAAQNPAGISGAAV